MTEHLDAFSRREFRQFQDLCRTRRNFSAVARRDEDGARRNTRIQEVKRTSGRCIVQDDERAFLGENVAHGGRTRFWAADLTQIFFVGQRPTLQNIKRVVCGHARPEDAIGKVLMQPAGQRSGQCGLAGAAHTHNGYDGVAVGAQQPGGQLLVFSKAAYKMSRGAGAWKGGALAVVSNAVGSVGRSSPEQSGHTANWFRRRAARLVRSVRQPCTRHIV